MTPKTSKTAAPAPPRVPSSPAEPSAPVAAGRGNPAPGEPLLEALPGAGPDVQRAAMVRGGEASKGRERPAGASPEALSGKAFRDAFKAAKSAKAKGQRQQRARPWQGRDPLRNAVPGGYRPPPKNGEQR